MSTDYTSNELINSLKSKGQIPTAQNTFQNSDFLRFFNDEQKDFIVPLILKNKNNYLIKYSDTTVGSSTSFSINSRAVAAKLKDVQRIATGGKQYSLPLLELENLEDYNNLTSSRIEGVYLMNNTIHLVGNINTTDSLRQYFWRKPSDLVLQSACALISAVDTATNTVTVSSVPSTMVAGVSVDVCKATPHFDPLLDDATISSVSGSDIVLDSLPSTVAVGDWVCLAGQTCVPQIPEEYHTVLVMRVAGQVLSALGDIKGSQNKFGIAKEIIDELTGTFSDRVTGEPRKIKNRNSFGIKSYFYRGW